DDDMVPFDFEHYLNASAIDRKQSRTVRSIFKHFGGLFNDLLESDRARIKQSVDAFTVKQQTATAAEAEARPGKKRGQRPKPPSAPSGSNTNIAALEADPAFPVTGRARVMSTASAATAATTSSNPAGVA